MSLLKENTYSKVLINATNKEHLTKNENEYIGNLFDIEEQSMISTNIDQSSPVLDKKPKQPKTISAASLRKINLLTAKERPFCSFCNNLVGYIWYVEKDQPANQEAELQEKSEDPEKLKLVGQPEKDEESKITLCKTCYEEKNYPQSMDDQDEENDESKKG